MPLAPHGEPEISFVFLFRVTLVVTGVLKAFAPMDVMLAGIVALVSCVP